MIVVRRMDLAKGWVEVANLGKRRHLWDAELERFATATWKLGFQELRVPAGQRNGDGQRQRVPNEGQSNVITAEAVETTHLRGHEWSLSRGLPVYEGEFEQQRHCLASTSRYAALLLCSYGPEEKHLMELRLAIYEIVANVLEHGHRESQHGRLWIHLRFGEGAISGWIQDSCERFDPFETTTMSLPENIQARRNRGYGIEIIRRLLDGLEHEFNETGNRITFKKRIFQ